MRPDRHATHPLSPRGRELGEGVCKPRCCPSGTGQHGFGLVAAMFVMIVVGGAIAAMVHLSSVQHTTTSMALQQARAYQAARAGVEWGIANAILGSCPANTNLPLGGLSGFTVNVTCVRTAAPVLPEESARAVPPVFYQLTATAQYGLPGSLDYAYRQLEVVIEV
ncbi:pilus assembly protein MshP [Stutzerimonas kirkiae]|uniref:Pilus assembly protein MshP n=2 Tax=Stutzerimonas kirkiae TaxID=2211392 RepID=A0A4Q9REC4_9GAMM|nr:pilus assembly protein MshP [Stutzerimonas kirkiae]